MIADYERSMVLKTPIKIDGRDWTLFKDYDKPKYIYLSLQGKIQYLEKRVQLILIDPLEEIKQRSLAKNTDEYYWLCLVILACCGIEATGAYLIGKDNQGRNKEAFTTFIKKYMKAHARYRDDLWKYFRNALAHGFCIEKGGIELKLPKPAQKIHGIVKINADEFFDEFTKAFFEYISSLRQTKRKTKLLKNFEKTWDWIFLT
jgi:hypothetical protein